LLLFFFGIAIALMLERNAKRVTNKKRTEKMKITIEMIISKNPAAEYSAERLTELWDGNESLTLMQISELDIPIADRIWAITRFLDDRSNRLFAADCAQRLIDSMDDGDVKTRSNALLYRVRDCANGVIEIDELQKYAAEHRDAAWDAAWAAAEAATLDAELAAEWAAATAATWDADRDAAREWQIAKLREYL
jgi:hypothetical protein